MEEEKDEIKEFLEKEIEICNKEIDKSQKTVNAAMDVSKYYARRKDYLLKLKALHEVCCTPS